HLASLIHFTVPVMRATCSLLLACTFPTAISFALTPPLNGGTLIEAFSLHVLKQASLGDLAAEFLQHRLQPLRLVHFDFHVALPVRACARNKARTAGDSPGPRSVTAVKRPAPYRGSFARPHSRKWPCY